MAEKPSEDFAKLIKLLKMTTSSNDGEALTAMRMANATLTRLGWDWDKLFAGKIKLIADPFASPSLREPPAPKAAPQSQAKPNQAAPPRQPRTTQQAAATPVFPQRRIVDNGGSCTFCGTHQQFRGLIYKHDASSKWAFFCNQPCLADWKANGMQRKSGAPLRPNLYAGHCVHCSNFVAKQQGFIQQNPTGKWEVVCSPTCTPKTAPPKAFTTTQTVDDL